MKLPILFIVALLTLIVTATVEAHRGGYGRGYGGYGGGYGGYGGYGGGGYGGSGRGRIRINQRTKIRGRWRN